MTRPQIDLAEPHADPGPLSVAIGLLPCPMTMLLLSYSVANGTLLGGLALTGVMALGITLTISIVGLFAMFARARLAEWVEARSRSFFTLVRGLEM